MSGLDLFQQAEMAYQRGDPKKAFELYQRSIKKILKDGNVTAPLPALTPPNYPNETLVMVWQNFAGFFRDTKLGFTEANSPEAFKLLSSFRPKRESKFKPQFTNKGQRGIIVCKAMQISAASTLGLMAWDKGDRVTAAKRYEEAIEVANTHAPFVTYDRKISGTERYVYEDILAMKRNLELIKKNDQTNAELVGKDVKRKETLSVPNTRIESQGQVYLQNEITFATDACRSCSERGTTFKKCGGCEKAMYCSADCQKADWNRHKATCGVDGNTYKWGTIGWLLSEITTWSTG